MKLNQETATQSDMQTQTLLSVDDNTHKLDIIIDFLEAEHFTILIARDGESALEKVRYGRPDLILLDVMMPGMDGFETCHRLKADPQTRDIPIIFMTALTGVKDKVKGFAVGAVDYITKPVQQEDVLARITTHLRLRQLSVDLHQELTRREQAETQFRQVVEAIPNAIVVIDETGKIVRVNRQTETLFGYPRAELVGQPIELLIPARFQPDHPHYRATYLAQPETRPMGHGRDLYGRHKDGREIPVEIGLSPIQTQEGTLILSVIVDITERKRAEEALETERYRLRTLIDNLPDLIFLKDRESRFMVANEATAEFMGVPTPEALLGKTDFDFYPPETAAEYYELEQEVIHLGQALTNWEKAQLDVQGNQHWLSTLK
jgi:PAS domain S-box-containing protein